MRNIKYKLENETAKLNKLTAIITLIGVVITLVLNVFLSKEKVPINNFITNNTYINNINNNYYSK